jgi:iron complex transport system substrate-binding protein
MDRDVIADELAAIDIPLLVAPAATTFDDVYSQLEQLGVATGNSSRATEVAADMQQELDDITATVTERDEALTYFHELDSTLYTVTSNTFIGEVYALAGLENVADAADDGTGYPQLSAEYLVDQDPDLIFLADTKCCGQSAATVAERPGWAELTAVRAGGVVELDDDIASRWGPRVVDFLEVIVDAVNDVSPVSAS